MLRTKQAKSCQIVLSIRDGWQPRRVPGGPKADQNQPTRGVRRLRTGDPPLTARRHAPARRVTAECARSGAAARSGSCALGMAWVALHTSERSRRKAASSRARASLAAPPGLAATKYPERQPKLCESSSVATRSAFGFAHGQPPPATAEPTFYAASSAPSSHALHVQ